MEVSVFGNDYPTADGTGVRDYIHVMDLAEGHAAALGFLSRTTGWHAINLGTGKGYSVLEMIQAFEKAAGRRVPYKIVTRRTGDVAKYYADIQKASKLMSWRAVRTLEDMCASTWQFQLPRKLSVTQ
jgi:UDP-glucose 4-epimerase